MMRLAYAPKELDLEGYVRNAGFHLEESCIIGGDVLGVRRLDAAFMA
jgi:hypothetical protein